MNSKNIKSALFATVAIGFITSVNAHEVSTMSEYSDCDPGMGYGHGMGYGNQTGYGHGMGYGNNIGLQQRNMPAEYMKSRFRMFDQNGNGLIDADEAATETERVFLFMDVDDNGELTEDEYMAINMGPQASLVTYGPRHQQRQSQKLARFKPMDTDSNGTVSKGEFLAASESRYQSSDLNKDGAVTVWEFRSIRR